MGVREFKVTYLAGHVSSVKLCRYIFLERSDAIGGSRQLSNDEAQGPT